MTRFCVSVNSKCIIIIFSFSILNVYFTLFLLVMFHKRLLLFHLYLKFFFFIDPLCCLIFIFCHFDCNEYCCFSVLNFFLFELDLGSSHVLSHTSLISFFRSLSFWYFYNFEITGTTFGVFC